MGDFDSWDVRHCWHPFTDQEAWESGALGERLMIERGEGCWLFDEKGRKYLDGNSSIWTNIHGHNHPKLNAAVQTQLGKIAHSSYLGFGNPRASELAMQLCGFFPQGTLERCFFSDDGSTAIEVALKMALQYRRNVGDDERRVGVAFDQAYHGDTLGAASVSGVPKFVGHAEQLGFEVKRVADLAGLSEVDSGQVAAVIIEPLIQGVNEMKLWPEGMLREMRRWCDEEGVHLILDEVMTGFGRTGKMFACQVEGVVPDFLCLAKGLTGGYLPMAATLTTEAVYRSFDSAEKAFYYGHSYTANQLGCAVALASLAVFEEDKVLEGLELNFFRSELERLKDASALVYQVRQLGMVAGVELRKPNGERFPSSEKVGMELCLALREFGVLTRPINDTIVLMPPLSISKIELTHLIDGLLSVLYFYANK